MPSAVLIVPVRSSADAFVDEIVNVNVPFSLAVTSSIEIVAVSSFVMVPTPVGSLMDAPPIGLKSVIVSVSSSSTTASPLTVTVTVCGLFVPSKLIVPDRPEFTKSVPAVAVVPAML